MTISFDDTVLQPLTTAEDILDRAGGLIGAACRRQTWFLFVDDGDVQLPLLVPLCDIPSPRDDDLDEGARVVLSRLCRAADAAGVIAVIERPGPPSLHSDDRAWARALHRAAATEDIDLRALLLSHDHGVRALGPDDLL